MYPDCRSLDEFNDLDTDSMHLMCLIEETFALKGKKLRLHAKA
jgi:hypothetical protein